MKRTEYSFGKIDFNGSRAVIPTEKARESKDSLAFFFCITIVVQINNACCYQSQSGSSRHQWGCQG